MSAIATMVLAVACGGPRAGDDAAKVVKLAFVTNNTAEFWTIAEAGTTKGEQECGVKCLFRRPPTGTAAEQKEQIEDLLTQGVQAIAISVNDPKNQHDYLNQIEPLNANRPPRDGKVCRVNAWPYPQGPGNPPS